MICKHCGKEIASIYGKPEGPEVCKCPTEAAENKKLDRRSPEFRAKQFAAEFYCYPEAEENLEEKLELLEEGWLRGYETRDEEDK